MELDLQKVADLITANVISTTKRVLTAEEAARYMGITRSYLYKLTMQNKIPYSKPLGKMVYFDREELEHWLLANRIETADEISEAAQRYCSTMKGKKGGHQ